MGGDPVTAQRGDSDAPSVPDPRFRDQLAERWKPGGGDRLAVDAEGYVWWHLEEGHWSMARTNPDNSPIPQPVTYYEPRSPDARCWDDEPGCNCGNVSPSSDPDALRAALVDAMPREWTTYAIRQHIADALLPLVEARVQAAANQRAAEIRREALHDAYWAVHVRRFDADHDEADDLRRPDTFYAGIVRARMAIAALAEPGAPVGIDAGNWKPTRAAALAQPAPGETT